MDEEKIVHQRGRVCGGVKFSPNVEKYLPIKKQKWFMNAPGLTKSVSSSWNEIAFFCNLIKISSHIRQLNIRGCK